MTIEEPYFSFENMDIIDEGDLVFGDCVLKQDIGPLKEGSEIEYITLLTSKSEIILRPLNSEEVKFKISLQIGEQI